MKQYQMSNDELARAIKVLGDQIYFYPEESNREQFKKELDLYDFKVSHYKHLVVMQDMRAQESEETEYAEPEQEIKCNACGNIRFTEEPDGLTCDACGTIHCNINALAG